MTKRQFVVFSLGQEEYGIEINQVQEIVRFPHITQTPNTSPFIEGIINFRENIIPLINLRTLFGLSYQENAESIWKSYWIIIVSVDEMTSGIIIDNATGIIGIEENHIQSTLEVAATKDIVKEYLKGIALINDRALLILNLYKILMLQKCTENYS